MSQDYRKGWSDHGADPRKSRSKSSAGVGGGPGSNKQLKNRKGWNDHGADPRKSSHKGSAGVGGGVSGRTFGKRKGFSDSGKYQDGGIVAAQAKYAAIEGLRNEMSTISGESLFSNENNYENGGLVQNKSSDIEEKLELAQEILGRKSESKEDNEEDLDNLSREELIARLKRA